MVWETYILLIEKSYQAINGSVEYTGCMWIVFNGIYMLSIHNLNSDTVKNHTVLNP